MIRWYLSGVPGCSLNHKLFSPVRIFLRLDSFLPVLSVLFSLPAVFPVAWPPAVSLFSLTPFGCSCCNKSGRLKLLEDNSQNAAGTAPHRPSYGCPRYRHPSSIHL